MRQSVLDSTLLSNIMDAKNGDNEALSGLIIKFNPLLTKYSNLLSCEDSKSELILCFIEAIKKLPLNMECVDEKTILSYIKRTIINSYINLNKHVNKVDNAEYVCEIQDWNSKVEFHSDIYFYDLLKYLSEIERRITILKYLNCLSDTEIAKRLNLSRQYINRLNRQAISKIKSNLIEV